MIPSGRDGAKGRIMQRDYPAATKQDLAIDNGMFAGKRETV